MTPLAGSRGTTTSPTPARRVNGQRQRIRLSELGQSSPPLLRVTSAAPCRTVTSPPL